MKQFYKPLKVLLLSSVTISLIGNNSGHANPNQPSKQISSKTHISESNNNSNLSQQSINRDSSTAYFGLGVIYEKQGKLSKAIQSYTQAIKRNPDLSIAYNKRGRVYLQKDNLNKALEDFNKVIKINPDFGSAYHNLGLVYMEQKEFDKAKEKFKKAANIFKNKEKQRKYQKTRAMMQVNRSLKNMSRNPDMFNHSSDN